MNIISDEILLKILKKCNSICRETCHRFNKVHPKTSFLKIVFIANKCPQKHIELFRKYRCLISLIDVKKLKLSESFIRDFADVRS